MDSLMRLWCLVACLLACLRLRWILAEPKNCVYPGLAELRKCLQTLVKKYLALR
jgi:hypothetical protein